ncbi:MAG: hypothetical protein CM15mP120_19140 [Pseudomonadota bacterium]|nr:MAG: hypothetical protein CM15mP120_19140 [Pseudomonadota bacterium]
MLHRSASAADVFFTKHSTAQRLCIGYIEVLGTWENHEAALLLFLHLLRATLTDCTITNNCTCRHRTRITVWFDSQCPLCIREIALMRRLDWFGRVDFVDIYAAQSCPLEPQLLLQRFHAQESNRPVISGGAAFAALWRHLPLLRPLGSSSHTHCAETARMGLHQIFSVSAETAETAQFATAPAVAS